jgi:hypothetical protein
MISHYYQSINRSENRDPNITCTEKYNMPYYIHTKCEALNEIQSIHKLDEVKYEYINLILGSCSTSIEFAIMKSFMGILYILCIGIFLFNICKLYNVRTMNELDRL